MTLLGQEKRVVLLPVHDKEDEGEDLILSPAFELV